MSRRSSVQSQSNNKPIWNPTRRFKILREISAELPTLYELRVDVPSSKYQDEDDVHSCSMCKPVKRDFTFFRRRRHCKSCGIVACGDCAPEHDDYDDRRVCKQCLTARDDLNQLAIDEHVERHRAIERIKHELFMSSEVHKSLREELISEEEEARNRLSDWMREQERMVNAKVHGNVSSSFGVVSTLERVRTRPIHGTRSGMLKIKIRRLKGLQAVMGAGATTSGSTLSSALEGSSNDKTENNNNNNNNNNSEDKKNSSSSSSDKKQSTTTTSNDNFGSSAGSGDVSLSSFGMSPSVALNYQASTKTVCDPFVQLECCSRIVARSHYSVPIRSNSSSNSNKTDNNSSSNASSSSRRSASSAGRGGRGRDFVARDFSLVEEFVFEVEDDRTGVLIEVLDETSLQREGCDPVEALLGIGFVNLRKRGVFEEEISPNNNIEIESWIQELTGKREQKRREQEGKQEEEEERMEDEIVYGNKHSSSLISQNSQNDNEIDDEQDQQEQQQQEQEDDEESPDILDRTYYKHVGQTKSSLSSLTSSSSQKSKNYKKKMVRNKKEDGEIMFQFSRYCEKGEETRALCNFEGHALSASQVTVNWVFYPFREYRITNSHPHSSDHHHHHHKPHKHHYHPKHIHHNILCEGCEQRDALGFCTCNDGEKEEREENNIKRRLRQAGGELHSREFDARRARVAGEKNDPFPLQDLPILHPKGREKIDACCC